MTIKIPLIADIPPGVSLYGDFGDDPEDGSFNPFSHIFTCCGAEGRLGPTLAQTQATYTSATWVNDANAFITDEGTQIWTVPVSGKYQVVAKGAAGGNGFTFWGANQGGRPANVSANTYLTRGDKIKLVVGQRGQHNSSNLVCSGAPGSGGGFTVVYNNTSANLIIMCSGGAGGSKIDNTLNDEPVKDANVAGPYGKPLEAYGNEIIQPAHFGHGGPLGTACQNVPSGAGGFYTSGNVAVGYTTPGQGFMQGSNGGSITQADRGLEGGFGGAGPSSEYHGGAAGAFTCGPSGGSTDCHCDRLSSGAAGGTFHNTALTEDVSIVHAAIDDYQGNGYVSITLLENYIMAWFYYGSDITESEPINFSIEYTQDNKEDWPKVIFYEENGKKYAKASADLTIQELPTFLEKAGYKTITEEKPKDTSNERYIWNGNTWLGQSTVGVSGIVVDTPGYTANLSYTNNANATSFENRVGLGANPNLSG